MTVDDIHRDARAAFDLWWLHTPHLHEDATQVQAHVDGLALRFARRLVGAAPGLSFEEAREQLVSVLTPRSACTSTSKPPADHSGAGGGVTGAETSTSMPPDRGGVV